MIDFVVAAVAVVVTKSLIFLVVVEVLATKIFNTVVAAVVAA